MTRWKRYSITTDRRRLIRYILVFALLPGLLVALPQPLSAAAPSLALPQSDYPGGAKVVVYPATNAEVARRFHLAHRSSFAQLHRLDGLGWLQAAIWHFELGRGTARQRHLVTYGYAINVFANAQQAGRAMHDLRMRVRRCRVAHIPALKYSAADAHVSLDFISFAYGSVEVEAYYEYTGTAPWWLARKLGNTFGRQGSRLAYLARMLNTSLHTTPTPVPTSTPIATPTSP